MLSWLWRCSSPQDWPSRPTAVGANAPSANRANVRPARAGAEPELANLGRVSRWGARPFFLFFLGEVSSGGVRLCWRRGTFFCPRARERPWKKRRYILTFCWSSRSRLIYSTRYTLWCSWGWGSRANWEGNTRYRFSCRVRSRWVKPKGEGGRR